MDEQVALWRQLKEQSSETARDKLVERHLPLVRYVLGRLAVTLPGHMDREDLAEAGVIGLIKAVQDFDPARQIKFSTFAVPRIRGAILDELRSQDWLPRSARRKAADVRQAYSALLDDERLPPSIDELAQAMRASTADVQQMLDHANAASFSSLETLQETGRDGARTRLADTLVDRTGRAPEGDAEFSEQEELLAQAVMQLSHQERIVVTLYYFKHLMLKEIAEALGVSKPRVSQIHNSAIEHMRGWVETAGKPAPASRGRKSAAAEPQLSLERLFQRARMIAAGKA